MSELHWILGTGAAAAVGYYLWRRDRDEPSAKPEPIKPEPTKPEPTKPELPLGRWVWPVGVWQDRKPEISDGFDGRRRAPSGAIIPHGGVDIMYRRKPGDPWKPGTPNGTPGWVMPDHRAVLAASDGVVWSAAVTARGGTVIIDHSPRKLATYYTHMSTLLVVPKQIVRAGTPIGIVGADPLDGQHVMHLHFESWRGASADRFDPQPLMVTSWEYLPDPGDLPRNGTARPRDHSHLHRSRHLPLPASPAPLTSPRTPAQKDHAMETKPTDIAPSDTAPSDTAPSDAAATTAEPEPAPSPQTEPVTADPDLAAPVAELIAAIRAAMARGASPEARRAGAAACRSLLAVFEATPGQPLVALPPPPVAPTASPPITSFAAMLTQPGFLAQLAAMSREQLVEMLRQFTGATGPRPPSPPTAAPRFHLIEIPNLPRRGS